MNRGEPAWRNRGFWWNHCELCLLLESDLTASLEHPESSCSLQQASGGCVSRRSAHLLYLYSWLQRSDNLLSYVDKLNVVAKISFGSICCFLPLLSSKCYISKHRPWEALLNAYLKKYSRDCVQTMKTWALKLTLLNTILLGRQLTIQRSELETATERMYVQTRRSISQSDALNTIDCTGRPSEGAELWSNIYRHGGNKLLHHSQRAGRGKTRKVLHTPLQLWVSVRAVSKLCESTAHPPTITVHQSHMSALFVPWFNL